MTEPTAPRRRGIAALTGFALILCLGTGLAALAEAPRPPCGAKPYPDYPAADAAPNIAVWTDQELADGLTPSACIAWKKDSPTLVVAVAGRFRDAAGPDEMLARMGAMSSLRGVRYWSYTEKQWNIMFEHVTALDGPDAKATRTDFSPAEMREGRDLYFLAADSRSRDEVISRLRVSGPDEDHLIIETTNVTPLRWFFLTFAATGNIQTWYFLEREAGAHWRFYSLTRVSYASPFFARFIHNESYVNRTVAMYRQIAGIPTDRNPPAAP